MGTCLTALAATYADLDFQRLDVATFSGGAENSIDYALMEKRDKVAVVLLNAGWSDVSSLNAWWQVSDNNSDGSIIKGDVLTANTRDSYLHSANG